jgi:hypothetical protein
MVANQLEFFKSPVSPRAVGFVAFTAIGCIFCNTEKSVLSMDEAVVVFGCISNKKPADSNNKTVTLKTKLIFRLEIKNLNEIDFMFLI